MRKNFRFLKRLTFTLGDIEEQYGWTILYFHIGRFSFNWLTEYGEWFIYFGHKGPKTRRVLRLSSAGNYYNKYDQGDIE